MQASRYQIISISGSEQIIWSNNHSTIEKANFWKSKKWQWNQFSEELWKIVSYENQIAPCRIENPVDSCLQMWEMKSRFFSSGAFRGRKNKESKHYDFCSSFSNLFQNSFIILIGKLLLPSNMILCEMHEGLIGAISLHIAYCQLHLPVINKLFGFHDIPI